MSDWTGGRACQLPLLLSRGSGSDGTSAFRPTGAAIGGVSARSSVPNAACGSGRRSVARLHHHLQVARVVLEGCPGVDMALGDVEPAGNLENLVSVAAPGE